MTEIVSVCRMYPPGVLESRLQLAPKSPSRAHVGSSASANWLTRCIELEPLTRKVTYACTNQRLLST